MRATIKKTTLLAAMALCALLVPIATAGAAQKAILAIEGGPEADYFKVGLSVDGRYYEIHAEDQLETGGELCHQGTGEVGPALLCAASAITGFEINGGAGNDTIELEPDVPVPATLRGGGGADHLAGGNGEDKLLGGPGADSLKGNGGNDWLFGGAGDDYISGGPGDDRLVGEGGNDFLNGGPGNDRLVGGPGVDRAPGPNGRSVLLPGESVVFS
jgi:hypothetical protein